MFSNKERHQENVVPHYLSMQILVSGLAKDDSLPGLHDMVKDTGSLLAKMRGCRSHETTLLDSKIPKASRGFEGVSPRIPSRLAHSRAGQLTTIIATTIISSNHYYCIIILNMIIRVSISNGITIIAII